MHNYLLLSKFPTKFCKIWCSSFGDAVLTTVMDRQTADNKGKIKMSPQQNEGIHNQSNWNYLYHHLHISSRAPDVTPNFLWEFIMQVHYIFCVLFILICFYIFSICKCKLFCCLYCACRSSLFSNFLAIYWKPWNFFFYFHGKTTNIKLLWIFSSRNIIIHLKNNS